MRHIALLALSAALLIGCAGGGEQPRVETSGAPVRPSAPEAVATRAPSPSEPAIPKGEVPREQGTLEMDIANALGMSLPSRVDLLDFHGSPPRQVDVLRGTQQIQLPIGDYRCYVHVYDHGVPILAEIQDIVVKEGTTTYLMVNILEGSGGRMGIHGFDSDGDLAIDRVEIASGTNPADAASVPGRPTLPYNREVLAKGARWYRGELNAQSAHGIGTESVGQLIRRAERAGLDFLAITDRNSMASIHDPEYKSSSVVLIPAMEWGDSASGYALIYGPRTEPDPPTNQPAAQAECLRVQAQGGVFAIARPCAPDAPWLWGLSYVNAVQVWYRDWRTVPPMSLAQLPEAVKIRDAHSQLLVHSIAAAAAAADLDDMSANVQSTRFWDYELLRGLTAAGIAGSGSGSPAVPLGSPVTYIYAEDKSLPALMEGLRLGRTYMSSGLNGPQITFSAEVKVSGGATVGMGGVVPIGVEIQLTFGVLNGQGKKVELLENGRPLVAKLIESNAFVTTIQHRPVHSEVYRVRVIGEPTAPGFGPIEVFAMSSPIYARDITREILWQFPNLDISKTWVQVEADHTPEVSLPEHQAPLEVGTPWIRPRTDLPPAPADGPARLR